MALDSSLSAFCREVTRNLLKVGYTRTILLVFALATVPQNQEQVWLAMYLSADRMTQHTADPCFLNDLTTYEGE